LSSSGEVEDHLLRIQPRPQESPEAPAAVAAVDRAMAGVAGAERIHATPRERLKVAADRIVRRGPAIESIPARLNSQIIARRRWLPREAVDLLLSD
jgi:hypothetical protein